MKRHSWLMAVALAFTPFAVHAQKEFSSPKPSVSVESIETAPLQKGKSAPITITFRVAPGFHINSNRPNSELLIPTTLRLDVPTDLSLGNLQYPTGDQVAFSFAPNEKLSVYAGEFRVNATARTIGSIHTGAYRVRGELHYQACDNSACYPPKSLPVAFDVKVVNPPAKPRHNPAQSPDVHN